MKKFLLFAFDGYYPAGGFDDFKDSFDTIEEAETEAVKLTEAAKWPSGYDFYHIVDRDLSKIVKANQ